MTRIALALFVVGMTLAPVRAQSIGPFGPGPHDADDARLTGRFADIDVRPGIGDGMAGHWWAFVEPGER